MEEDLDINVDENNFNGDEPEVKQTPAEKDLEDPTKGDEGEEGIKQTTLEEPKQESPPIDISAESTFNKIKTTTSDIASSINKATGYNLYTPYAEKLPTMEEFLGTDDYDITKAGKAIITGDFSNPDVNAIMDKTVAGRIAKQIGSAVTEPFASGGNLGIEPGGKFEKTLQNAGILNDHINNRLSFIKNVNEAFIRPTASVIDTGWRTAQAALGALGAPITQGAEEIGGAAPELAEWAMTDIPALEAIMPHVPKPSTLSKAKEMGILDGEDIYFGLQDATPQQKNAHVDAARETESLQKFVEEQRGAEIAQPKDIHDIAREINPEMFDKFSGLSAKKQFLKNQIEELGTKRDEEFENTPPHSEELNGISGKIQDLLGKVNNVESRLTNKQTAKLDELRNQYDELSQKSQTAAELDTPEMAKTREELQKTDYAMRDIAPDISSAYRAAQKRMPKIEEEPVEEKTKEPEINQPEIEFKTEEQVGNQVPIESNVIPLELNQKEKAPAPFISIADDVSQKLIAAGRPTEEANAAALIVSEHYKTIQEQGWVKGTPEEIYRRHGADIVTGLGEKQKGVKKLSQGKAARTQGFLRRETNTIHLMGKADASTFIHETGHKFLEEMMEFGKEKDAPISLKNDIQTVNNWLKVKEGEEITITKHEKFARGFERYIMEGIAPSQALANVFAKFKQWLTSIYQTVGKLRAPITDDIRDVFDRLLSSKPEKTVIAPEKESAKIIENLHEIQAERTPDTKAAEVRDNIRSTVDRLTESHEPGLYEELKASESQARTGSIPSEAEGTTESPSTTEPVANTPNQAEQPSPVNASGSEIRPEGIATRPESTKPTDKSIGVNDNFKDKETKFVDKAGNVRLDNLDMPDDVKQAIRDAATRNEAKGIDMTRGVVTDAQAWATAQASGLKVSDLENFRAGKAYTKEEIFAIDDLLKKAAIDVKESQKLLTDASTDEEYLDWYEKVARQEMILDTVFGVFSGATAEGGRTLQALGAIRKSSDYLESRRIADILKQETGRDLFQIKKLAKVIGEMETPAQVAKSMVDARKPGIGAMMLELLFNNYLSGWVTHKGYIVGNQITALYKAVIETPVEATTGIIKNKITGENESRAYFGEIIPQLRAMFKAHTSGLAVGYESAKLGQTLELPHEQLDLMTERQKKLYDEAKTKGASYEDAVKAAGGEKGVTTPFTQTKAIPGALGVLIRAPSERMVAPIHSFFRAMGYNQSIARQTYRIALDEGLTGTAFNNRIAELTDSPTEEMMTNARFEANEQTLMAKGGEFTKKVTSFLNWEPVLPLLGPTKPLRFISPFIHVKANIMDQAIFHRGPLGLMFSGIREDIAGTNGSIKQNAAIAKMAAGTAFSIGAAFLYKNDRTVTPAAPKDYKEATLEHMTYGPPHSLKIHDVYYDLNRLGPLGVQAGIAADGAHLYDRIGKDSSDKIGALLMHSLYNNLVEENSLGGLSEFFKATEDYNFGQQYIKNFATSFTPYSVGLSQTAKSIDPYQREARSLIDKEMAKLPYKSEKLYPKIDIWGEPTPNISHGFHPFTRSDADVYQEKMVNDPVNRRLYDLGIFPTMPRRQIGGIQLTDKQYNEYAVLSGHMMKQQLDQYVQLTDKTSIPPGEDINEIKNIMKEARKYAAGTIMDNYPSILETAQQDKRDFINTGKKAKK